MATPKKPTPKKTFTATVTTEKQQNIKVKTNTANMIGKAKTLADKPRKQTGSVGTKWETMKKSDAPKSKSYAATPKSMIAPAKPTKPATTTFQGRKVTQLPKKVTNPSRAKMNGR